MKNKKKFFSVLVLSVTLLGMFIIGCSNDSGKDAIAQGGDTETISTLSATESGNSSTENSTESVVGTEEVENTEEIEATEETETEEKELPDEAESALKEEEEILKITPTNDSVNNGSGSSEKEVYNAPAVASVDNPIVKVATGNAPVEFFSGNIPAGKKWYYKVSATKGYYFCIENENAAIIYDGKTYTSEKGKVLLLVQDEVSEFAIMNKANKAENFTVSVVEIEELTGTKENPKVIEIATDEDKVNEVKKSLKAGDEDGYYYSWKAAADGEVDFSVLTTSLEEMKYDIIITSNSETVRMSEGELSEDGTKAIVTASVVKGERVLIQIIAKKDGDSYPAVETAFKARLRVAGTIENPIEIAIAELPGDITDIKIPVGKTYFEYIRNLGGTQLTVESTDIKNLKVHQDSDVYESSDEIISMILAKVESTVGQGSFVIENIGTAEVTCTLKFEYVEGTDGNPSEIVIKEGNSITVSHTFAENEESYCYQWKAPIAGTMKFDISATTDVDWQYSIVCETKNIFGDTSDSILEGETDTVFASREYQVGNEDVTDKECVFIIKVNTYAIENGTTPDGIVSFTLTFDEALSATTTTKLDIDEVVSEEVLENPEMTGTTEVLESTEVVEEIEVIESTEEIVESTENVETTERVEVVEPIALRMIRNWYIRLFSK